MTEKGGHKIEGIIKHCPKCQISGILLKPKVLICA
jgi:hypothetical protein